MIVRSTIRATTPLIAAWLVLMLPQAQADSTPPPWSDRPSPQAFDSNDLKAKSGVLTEQELRQYINEGERLFGHRFSAAEGGIRPLATQAILPTKRKRPPRNEYSRTAGLDANACASCHHAPLVGGAGDFSANVFVSEGFRHTDFDTTDPQFSNERNTNHLFGAGLIELLAREMSDDLLQQRSAALREARRRGQPIDHRLITKDVDFGAIRAYPDGRVDTRELDGVDADLIIRPFSHKGVMTSLRQFTVNALNHHHGIQASERFGPRWTDEEDFDGDGLTHEIGAVGVSALVAWQATLAPPERKLPTVGSDGRPLNDAESQAWLDAANRGEHYFTEFGCAHCHRPNLPLESLIFADPGPLDAAGTLRDGESIARQYDLSMIPAIARLPRDAQGRVLVPLYGDLKRHVISDRQVNTLGNELLSQRFVERNVFQTTELWGVGSTAPYGHRGDQVSLSDIIAAHGGAARAARDAWLATDLKAREDLIAFLKTLRISP